MTNYLTPGGLEKLKKELDYLKNVKRKEIAERLKHAISFGDLKENAAYDEAKDAQSFLEGRILELEKLIRNAVLIKEGGSKDKVDIGTTVTIMINSNKKNSEKEKYIIVGPAESDPLNGKISIESPLGKKLLNLKEGDVFEIDTSGGEVKYKVVKIE